MANRVRSAMGNQAKAAIARETLSTRTPPGDLHAPERIRSASGPGVRAQGVYRALRRAIIEQALKPGMKLPEDTIGEKLGVSRTLVREAFGRLAIEGLVELKPNTVKKSLTGFGHAEKGQMQRAVQSMFDLPEPPSPPDVADAIAIALCAARRHGM